MGAVIITTTIVCRMHVHIRIPLSGSSCTYVKPRYRILYSHPNEYVLRMERSTPYSVLYGGNVKLNL